MGRIKDLVIDLQNEYGYNLEDLPEGFDMDRYLEEKSKEQEQEKLFCERFKESR